MCVWGGGGIGVWGGGGRYVCWDAGRCNGIVSS